MKILLDFFFNFFFNPIICNDINISDSITKEVSNLQRLNLIKTSTFEQTVNNCYLIPVGNFWSILELEYLGVSYIILILLMPLVYCIIFLIFVFYDFALVYFFGRIFWVEDKSKNFFFTTREMWWMLWGYTYDWIPRYQHITLVRLLSDYSDWVLSRYPDPKHSLSLFYQFFLTSYKPKLLWMSMTIFLTFLCFFYKDMPNTLVFWGFYGLAIYYDDIWDRRRWPLGYKLYLFMTFFQWKKEVFWDGFYERLHLWSWIAFYPIFLNFLLFLFVTCLTIYLYLDFFFNPILTWNGYFSKTIVCFFFTNTEFIAGAKVPLTFDYFIGLDGLNIWLIWLTSLLVLLCGFFILDTLNTWNFFAQLGWIFLLEFASFQFFCVPNYFWMYVYFELSLLPIFILIVFWGSNRRKIHAAYQMVLFTFIGSLFLLAGIFMLFIKVKTFNCFDIFFVTQSNELNLIFSNFEKKIIWLLLFIGFAVKTPLYPFHIWLPEAHSEAPTTGSVLLAGVLLKMGTYGFLWFVMPLFPSVLETFKTLVFSMCLCGILLSSLSALAQIDIKKIIAYSSIGHMGLVVLGIYNMNLSGLLGANYMMISHGLVSSALFFAIGTLYKIYGTRSLIYFASLAHFMPRFSMCFFIFSLANMSFPGTAGFPGELLIFSSLMGDNFFLSIFVGIGSIFGGVYSIWLLTRILYGQISPKISIYWDIKAIERKILNFLMILIVFFGIFPFLLLDFFKPLCLFYLDLYNF